MANSRWPTVAAAAFLIFTSPALALPAGSLIEKRVAPACVDFEIPITASANNLVILQPGLNLSTIDGVTSFLSSSAGIVGTLLSLIPQTLSVPISARYCAPDPAAKKVPPERANHVQFLLHGIPYTKEYWQGLNYPNGPEPYDWVSFATAKGYPVLLVDNLGNGNSSTHPDPVLQVQQPLEIEIYHKLLGMLRAGTIGNGVPKAEKIIFVGHSYASVLANGLMAKYPTDVDAAILTGWSYTFAQGVPVVLFDELTPASLYSPSKYGSLNPGYVTFESFSGREGSYYGPPGSYDDALAYWDYQTQGVTTLGELVTFFSGLQTAPNFKGHVMAITGKIDALFCGPGSNALGKPNCGNKTDGIVQRSGEFFPNAATYQFFLPAITSHATNLAKTSGAVFKMAHKFLNSTGY